VRRVQVGPEPALAKGWQRSLLASGPLPKEHASVKGDDAPVEKEAPRETGMRRVMIEEVRREGGTRITGG
jgi:hypothetical protein